VRGTDGSLLRSKNVLEAIRLAPGEYCVRVDPSVDVAISAPVVSHAPIVNESHKAHLAVLELGSSECSFASTTWTNVVSLRMISPQVNEIPPGSGDFVITDVESDATFTLVIP
jgi:hypothetical protein